MDPRALHPDHQPQGADYPMGRKRAVRAAARAAGRNAWVGPHPTHGHREHRRQMGRIVFHAHGPALDVLSSPAWTGEK